MGLCVGDYDNDTDLDFFITNYDADLLLRNNGDGTFTNVAEAVGVANEGVGWYASFVDYDNEGIAIFTSLTAMSMAHRRPIAIVSITIKTDNLLTVRMPSTSLLMLSHVAQLREILITMAMSISTSSTTPAIPFFKTTWIPAFRNLTIGSSNLRIDASKLS